jgi:hypothetical protein
MSAVSSNSIELKPAGGVHVKNARGETVFWFKAKQKPGERTFAICLFRPQLCDSARERRRVKAAFHSLLKWARLVRVDVYDMEEFEREAREMWGELGAEGKPRARAENVTFVLPELTSGERRQVTFTLRPKREDEI